MAAEFTAAQVEAVAAALDSNRHMAKYYDTSAKRAQNTALAAAGLAPLYAESSFSWDDKSRAEHEGRIPALESLLEIMQPAATEEAA